MSSPSSNEILVPDTGPLLALARLDLCQLLPQLFKSCWITASVLEECLAKPKRPDALKVGEAVDKRYSTPVSDPAVRKALRYLDRGEQTAIEFALQNQSVLLIDEHNGRQVAKGHNLKVIGTLGILLLAKQKGLVREIKPHLINLTHSGYYLSEALLRHALELANE